MWGQVSLEKALRAFLTGRTVKVVNFNAETVLSLSEVFERFSEGVVFFAETVAVENIEFKEAVEDMTASAEIEALKKDNAELTKNLEIMATEYGDLSAKYAELDAAYAIAQNPAPGAQDPEPEPKKKRGRKATNGKSVGRNKPVSQVEAEWAARKVTDIPKLKALRTAGWSVKDLADEFHCTEETVAETIAKEGIA